MKTKNVCNVMVLVVLALTGQVLLASSEAPVDGEELTRLVAPADGEELTLRVVLGTSDTARTMARAHKAILLPENAGSQGFSCEPDDNASVSKKGFKLIFSACIGVEPTVEILYADDDFYIKSCIGAELILPQRRDALAEGRVATK